MKSFEQIVISCMLLMYSVLFFVFLFSIAFFLSFLSHLSHFIPSFNFSISAHSPCPSPKIYHLKCIDPFTSHWTSPPCLFPTPCLSCSLSSSSSASSFSSSFSSCWYSPSVWPSAEECCQYILWVLVPAFMLLFFTSSYLIFFTDHHTICHCGPHQTPTLGPGSQRRVPLHTGDPTDTQCKSSS